MNRSLRIKVNSPLIGVTDEQKDKQIRVRSIWVLNTPKKNGRMHTGIKTHAEGKQRKNMAANRNGQPI